jgi:hypothetical protein
MNTSAGGFSWSHDLIEGFSFIKQNVLVSYLTFCFVMTWCLNPYSAKSGSGSGLRKVLSLTESEKHWFRQDPDQSFKRSFKNHRASLVPST